MDQTDRLRDIQESVNSARTEMAVFTAKQDIQDLKVDDHETRIRKLEGDVGNNKLVLRAVFLVSAAIGSSALAVVASAVKGMIS